MCNCNESCAFKRNVVNKSFYFVCVSLCEHKPLNTAYHTSDSEKKKGKDVAISTVFPKRYYSGELCHCGFFLFIIILNPI